MFLLPHTNFDINNEEAFRLKKMKAVGRLEHSAFKLVGKRVNHYATVTDSRQKRSAVINFTKWWPVKLTGETFPIQTVICFLLLEISV